MVLSLSLLLGFILARRRLLRRGIPEETIANLAILAAPAMLIGARLYHVVTDWHLYATQPVRALFFWNGGFGLWGAAAGGLLVAWWYSKRASYDFWNLANGIAPVILFVIALGRWANILSGELIPFAYFDSMLSGISFVVVSVLEKKNTFIREHTFLIVLGMYAMARFFGEFLRAEPRILDVLTVNQVVCLMLLVVVGRKLYLTESGGKNIIHEL